MLLTQKAGCESKSSLSRPALRALTVAWMAAFAAMTMREAVRNAKNRMESGN